MKLNAWGSFLKGGSDRGVEDDDVPALSDSFLFLFPAPGPIVYHSSLPDCRGGLAKLLSSESVRYRKFHRGGICVIQLDGVEVAPCSERPAYNNKSLSSVESTHADSGTSSVPCQ